ncbi:MAG: hypothetical protein H6736_14940 [Alphaproteobacteria bacterium]|nr:hypothetical protein [Alphaproteobacteria bacterium]MCB9693104.1 hypothetical protein [Alphaproteobacteria bacterium]
MHILLASACVSATPAPPDPPAPTPVVVPTPAPCTISLLFPDADGDGFGGAVGVERCPGPGWVTDGSDCDDSDATVNPAADEVCGGGDEDCDGLVDDSDPSVVDGIPAWRDADSDGFGGGESVLRCDLDGWSTEAGDCDDTADGIHPGAVEVCDGVDDDCDTLTDDADPDLVGGTLAYRDLDGDGFGSDSSLVCAVELGWVEQDGDCDDSDPLVNPGAVEVCGGTDEDCDGSIDDGDPSVVGRLDLYADLDGDGVGAGAAVLHCPGEGWSDVATDCDDTDATVLAAGPLYTDSDGDGFGAGTPVVACPTAGLTADATDCDDGDAQAHPGSTEVCGGGDEDCDGAIDAADDDTFTLFADDDGDGFGGVPASACGDTSGSVVAGGDCDDTDPDVHPGAIDAIACDGVDSDCDPAVPATLEVPWQIPTIGGAIAAAGADATICVAPGLYEERLVIPAGNLAIIGTAGPDATVVDAQGLGRTVTLSGGSTEVTLRGLTFRNGAAVGDQGGNVFIGTGRPVHLEHVVIENGIADEGGGLYADYDCRLTLTDTVVSNNYGASGGGGLFTDWGVATLTRVTLTHNSTDATQGSDGGGMYLRADALVEDTLIADNGPADVGGGGVSSGELLMRRTRIERNDADFRSDALHLAWDATLENVAILDNGVADWTYGALGVRGSVMVALRNVISAGNTREGLYSSSFTSDIVLDIDQCAFVGNSKGVHLSQDYGTTVATVRNTTITGNGVGVDINDSTLVTFDVMYSNLWGNTTDLQDEAAFTPGSDGNLSVDPGFVAFDGSQPASTWDLQLTPGSALIDAGAPAVMDADATRSDIGPYGGPSSTAW